jgi:chemotaxis protein MotA
MDIATVLGIISGFSLIIIAITMGGGITLFINVPSIMIVLGGTIAATLINFPLKQVIGVMGVVKKAFSQKRDEPADYIPILVDFATKARREGVLALEAAADTIEDEFLETGVHLAVDGTEPNLVKDILETEMDNLSERHRMGASIMDAMGAYAPALGMIGTLIGLIQMLQQLDDPKSIGPAMAVALVTTFYGALLANIVFIPIAGKLKTRSSEEIMKRELILHGINLIQTGENPRILEQKLNAFLPPKYRKSSFK